MKRGWGWWAQENGGESKQTSCERVWNVLLMQKTKVSWHQLINIVLGRKEEFFPLQGHPLFHIKCFSTFGICEAANQRVGPFEDFKALL